MEKASSLFDNIVCSKVEICEILDRTLLGRRVASWLDNSTRYHHVVEVCSHVVVEVCSSMQ